MGYSKEHVRKVRETIVAKAADLFRNQGYAKTSVAQVMETSGMTHGGFYAHFGSKEKLFEAVLADDLNYSRALKELFSLPKGTDIYRMAVNYYLEIENRSKVGRACTLVTLSSEVARLKKGARSKYTARLEELFGLFQTVTGDRKKALSTVALCVGALCLARAVDRKELAEEILESAREMLG